MGNIIDEVMTAPAWEEELGKGSVYKAIQDEAISAGIKPKEFMQLAQIESNFKTTAESPTGYRGLFQLDPNQYMGSPPFNPPSLFDPITSSRLAAKEYKSYKGDFLTKVIGWNQGKKGGQQILNAFKAGGSIKSHSAEPWNRTKKILHNLSDDNLNILADKYKLKGNRNQLINLMIDKKSKTFGNLSDDPLLVNLYVAEQQGKVKSSSKEVDKILKEM